jgi:hypothetical protein
MLARQTLQIFVELLFLQGSEPLIAARHRPGPSHQFDWGEFGTPCWR